MLQIIEMNHISWILMVYTHTEIIFSCCNFSKTCQKKYQSNMKRICIFPNNMHYLFLFPICDRDIIFFVLTCQLLYLTYKLTNIIVLLLFVSFVDFVNKTVSMVLIFVIMILFILNLFCFTLQWTSNFIVQKLVFNDNWCNLCIVHERLRLPKSI